MEAFVTVLAALVIASPLIVLALRTTRWDPVARPRPRRVLDERDADARRAVIDDAALAAHAAQASVDERRVTAGRRGAASAHRSTSRTARPGAPRLG